jgi:hypothetical protein
MARRRGVMSLLGALSQEQMTVWRKRLAAGDVLWHDATTGLVYDKGKEYNPRIVELAVQRWRPRMSVAYAEGDVANLSGLNRELGQSGADDVVASMIGFYKEEFLGLPGDVAFLRKGGDEFGVTTVGPRLWQVKGTIDRAARRVIAYVRKEGLDSLPHTKMGMPAGTGVKFALVQYDPRVHSNPDDLRYHTESALEKMKKGALR